ncbi:tetratricopeptide repeat protein [Leclercia adecarboxylata]|uniref:protein O-GlcNAc transferase n=1 Tax=Leclercia adecarboxylata TaxID=83655 RepID=A0ABU6I2L4_9ENTR|nr:tetratricopeptide repeat protein [Leclercia adecarboxylata]MCH2682181.1 hypothetical protein [Leclercia adecarboxylata]MDV5240035.1 hypothetical protein [Leclercia adecarboxylata]MDV5276599.1 hypothetical protein [Leclercia adecarboxylata]MDV5460818.1 hypothetical protein [Leclercia adecarboxylata]MDV5504035.1 hypothetical protein [Leclercia adecarboxylata]
MSKSTDKIASHYVNMSNAAVLKKIRQALLDLSTHPEKALSLINQLLSDGTNNALVYIIACKANQQLGRYSLAEESIEKALRIDPNSEEAIFTKADMLYKSDRVKDAENYLKDIVLRFGKKETRPLRALYATVLLKQKKYQLAQALYKELIEETPNDWSLWNNLGMLSQDSSQFDIMEAAYNKSLAVSPNDPTPYFNLIVGSHYNPERSAEDILLLCKAWQRKYKTVNFSRAEAKNKSAAKRLRIGLISDGLRSHPVGHMIMLGLSHIPQSQMEFYAYSTNYKEDHLTHRIKRMCAKWQVIESILPSELDKIIRADEVDILFDLCGYNSNSRMQTLQMAPAPILIKWVGGLISSTGLETMDYLLSDKVETPEGVDALYTEKLIRMPDDYICYNPPFYLPALNDNPYKKNGYITFGCFNNASKINEPLLAQWAVLLNCVPESRLFLKSFNFDDQTLTERVYLALEKHGISRERMRIEGASPHQELLMSYHDVDIALDPWPYSGGLTTCEAMAMGVPVVTLPGPTFAGRHSATHLVNAGLQELVAKDWQNYIDICVGLARDVESLSIIRSNLRDILLASPVCDGQRFARNFADAMRAVWQRYCEGQAPAALTLNNDMAPHFEGDLEPMVLVIPNDDAISHANVQENGFEFNLSSKIFTMDYGATLATSNKFITLAGFETFFFILMDTVGEVQEVHLPLRRKSIQHITLHALGNGEPAPAWLCLDNHHSSNLKPLIITSAQIITEVQTQTSRLDDIHGLDKLDWFVLDNRYDLKPVFEFGQRILSGCLAVEVRVSFSDTHEGQMAFDNIRRMLSDSGLVFHNFSDIEYAPSLLPEGYEFLKTTKMLAAKALFLPCESRLAGLDIGQREKLAFILHAVYNLRDVAYSVLKVSSLRRADDYLSNMKDSSNNTSAHTLPQNISVIPDVPRMSTLETALFERCLLNAERYFEFGSGGSTKLATRNNIEVYGVESDKLWVENLHNEAGELCKVDYVDIGPTKAWGYPVDDTHKEKFLRYSEAILKHDCAFDFILIDGRFRVACTLNTVKHVLVNHNNINNALIFIHDFWGRPEYFPVLAFLEVVQVEESAGLFRLKQNINISLLEETLDKYKYNPA